MCLLTLPFRSTRPNIPSPRKTSPIQLAHVESDPNLLMDGCDCNIVIIVNRYRKVNISIQNENEIQMKFRNNSGKGELTSKIVLTRSNALIALTPEKTTLVATNALRSRSFGG
jgi:hypothetical protein